MAAVIIFLSKGAGLGDGVQDPLQVAHNVLVGDGVRGHWGGRGPQQRRAPVPRAAHSRVRRGEVQQGRPIGPPTGVLHRGEDVKGACQG